MARSAQELFDEAMRLDPQERATLMRLLIDALDAETEEGAEDAWRAEVETPHGRAGLGRGGGGSLGRGQSEALPTLNGAGACQVPPCCGTGGRSSL